MASGLLSLKWNNHRTTFFHVLSTVRSKEAYCDVTLACEGKFYPVHKLVLSTCSDYFERMFERTNCKHPIIVLKDIRHDELEALLNYMYVGEVNVLQNELAGLIKAAECLMIKGLAVPDEAPAKESKRGSIHREDSPHAKRRKRDDDGRSSSHNQHLHREGRDPPSLSGGPNPSSSRLSSSASLPTPPPRIAPPISPSASVGSASDALSEDISQSQSETNDAQEPTKRPHKEQTSSQPHPVTEVILDEVGVKEEPEEIEEEVTETKEMLDPDFPFDPLHEGDSRSDPGGGYDSQVLSSQPQSMDDLVAQAIPGSSGLQGNSLWEGEGSLQGFPMEGFSGEGSRPPQMVMLPVRSIQDAKAVEKEEVTEGVYIDVADHPGLSMEQSFKEQNDGRKKSLKCNYCYKVFTNNWKLQRHIRIHTGERPFKCEICDYRAVQKSDIRAHMFTHSKRFKCPHCPVKTPFSDHPRQSMEQSLEKQNAGKKKSFQCNYCYKVLKDNWKLQRHIRIHTGERPFKCEICDYRAIQKSDITAHMPTHIQRFKCPHCPYRTPIRAELAHHTCHDDPGLRKGAL